MTRVSTYLITVPLEDEGRALLFHGLRGTVDIVAHSVAAQLESYRDAAQTMLKESLSGHLFAHLLARGHITDLTQDEERGELIAFANRLETYYKRQARPSYVFVVTYGCNLRCSYCYQQLMPGWKANARLTLTSEQIDSAFKIIDASFERTGSSQIGLYGGEPLSSRTADIAATLVHRASSRGVGVSATTNGFDLHHYASLLGPGLLEDLLISLDGPPETHDARRYRAGRRPTFARIADNVSLALSKGVRVHVRVNLDRSNLDALPDLVQEAGRRGWLASTQFDIYHALVSDSSTCCTGQPLLSDGEVYDYLEAAERDLPILSQLGAHTGSYLPRFFNAVPPTVKTRACGAASELLFFAPDWLVYTCQEVVGIPEQAVGRYDNGLNVDTLKLQAWRGWRIPDIPACTSCPYVLLCAGSCPYAAIVSPGQPPCHGFPEMFKLTVQKERRRMLSSRNTRESQAPRGVALGTEL